MRSMTRKAQARPLLDAAAFCLLNATAGENDKGREWACLPFSSAQPTAFALVAVTRRAKTGEAWLSAKHNRTARSATPYKK